MLPERPLFFSLLRVNTGCTSTHLSGRPVHRYPAKRRDGAAQHKMWTFSCTSVVCAGKAAKLGSCVMSISDRRLHHPIIFMWIIFKLLFLTASISLHISLVETTGSNGSSGSSHRDVWQHKRVANSFKYYHKTCGSWWLLPVASVSADAAAAICF